jgi:DNA-directed RNA polymerase specialized sigma24 family protein
MCFLVTLDRETAADAAQEALSRAWRDWDRVGTDRLGEEEADRPAEPPALPPFG